MRLMVMTNTRQRQTRKNPKKFDGKIEDVLLKLHIRNNFLCHTQRQKINHEEKITPDETQNDVNKNSDRNTNNIIC